jgi:hypothetical protein
MSKAIIDRIDGMIQQVECAIKQYADSGTQHLGDRLLDARKLLCTLSPPAKAEDEQKAKPSGPAHPLINECLREERRELLRIVGGSLDVAMQALPWVEGRENAEKAQEAKAEQKDETPAQVLVLQRGTVNMTDDNIVKAAQEIVAMRRRRIAQELTGRDTSDHEQLETLLAGMREVAVSSHNVYGVGPRAASLLLDHIKAIEHRARPVPELTDKERALVVRFRASTETYRNYEAAHFVSELLTRLGY